MSALYRTVIVAEWLIRKVEMSWVDTYLCILNMEYNILSWTRMVSFFVCANSCWNLVGSQICQAGNLHYLEIRSDTSVNSQIFTTFGLETEILSGRR